MTAAKVTRPRLTAAVARGLRTVVMLADADLAAGVGSDFDDGEEDDAIRAVEYLRSLTDWHEARAKRGRTHG